VVQFDTMAPGAISFSTLPPARGTRTGYTERSSVTNTVSDFPSALKRGDPTPRSRSSVPFTRTGALDPSEATSVRCCIP